MYKNIALLALLLPFSGYTITKQERKQEIEQEVSRMQSEMAQLAELIENNSQLAYTHRNALRQKVIETLAKLLELQKEHHEIEMEQLKEEKCTKK